MGFTTIRKQPCYPKPKFKVKYELSSQPCEGGPNRVYFGGKQYATYPVRKGKKFLGQKPASNLSRTIGLLHSLGEDTSDFHLSGGKIDAKGLMKHAVELVGPKALRRANAMTWTENVFCWPEGVVKLLRPVLGNPLGAVSHNRVYVAFKYEEILSEVYHDGLVHLAPVTAFLGKTPQEMRQILGRGLWKRLLAQSPNRINLIGECVSTVGEGNLQEHISKLIPIRSGILRRRPWVASKAQAAASILSPRVEDFNRTYHLLADLAHMKSVSGEVMNWDWSWTRMKEEHEIETARLAIVRRKQREARDASLSEEFTEATTHTVDGYTFTRLNTKGKISDEGDFMAHCVGSYGSRAYSRQYDVYKVEGPDERATLGVSLAACALKGAEGKALWASYNQCYQKRNQRVSKELEEACYKLISELNEGKEPLVSSTRYY